MIRSTFFYAASAAFLLAGAGMAKAELIYGFETVNSDGPDGFHVIDADNFGQSTIGVTQGTYSGDVSTPLATGGYSQGDITTTENPVDLQAATSATFDVLISTPVVNTTSGNGYATVHAITYLEGTGGKEKRLEESTFTNIGADVTETQGVVLPLMFKDPDGAKDGNGTTATFSAAQIEASDSASEGITYSAGNFQLQFTTNDGFANAPADLDIYLDNVQVTGTPEPASLSLLAASGLFLMRRRTR